MDLSRCFGRDARNLKPFFYGVVEQELSGSGREIVGVNHEGREPIVSFEEGEAGKVETTGTIRTTQPCGKAKGIGADPEPDFPSHDKGEKFLQWGGGLKGLVCRFSGGICLE